MENQNKKETKNLILKSGCNILRLDLYKNISGIPTIRINCIEDDSDTIDLDGQWVESYIDASYCINKEDEIDLIISKLKEAKTFFKNNAN